MAGERNHGWPGFFRTFAVFAALMLLLAQSGQELVGVSSGTWQVLSIYEGLTRWSIPALFMGWGMYALEGGGKPSLGGSLLGLALPAFCMLVFWVLYPLIGLYLVHPLLQRFASSASRGEILYILALAFLFASVLPVWASFHPNWALTALLERFQVHMVLGYMGYYLAGWYLRHFVIGRAAEFLLYLLGVLGLVVTLAGPSLIGGGRELWYSYTAPGVALTAAALCALFRYVLGVSEERSRRRAVYSLGECVFGVYLFHQLWALVFRWFGISQLALGAAASVPVFALVYFLLSLPFAWLFSRVPGAGRWLAG